MYGHTQIFGTRNGVKIKKLIVLEAILSFLIKKKRVRILELKWVSYIYLRIPISEMPEYFLYIVQARPNIVSHFGV